MTFSYLYQDTLASTLTGLTHVPATTVGALLHVRFHSLSRRSGSFWCVFSGDVRLLAVRNAIRQIARRVRWKTIAKVVSVRSTLPDSNVEDLEVIVSAPGTGSRVSILEMHTACICKIVACDLETMRQEERLLFRICLRTFWGTNIEALSLIKVVIAHLGRISLFQ